MSELATAKENLVIYPNPLGSECVLKLRKKNNDELKVKLFDIQGTEIGQYQLNGSQNEIDLKELKAGVYILKSESASGTTSAQLIVL